MPAGVFQPPVKSPGRRAALSQPHAPAPTGPRPAPRWLRACPNARHCPPTPLGLHSEHACHAACPTRWSIVFFRFIFSRRRMHAHRLHTIYLYSSFLFRLLLAATVYSDLTLSAAGFSRLQYTLSPYSHSPWSVLQRSSVPSSCSTSPHPYVPVA